MTKRTLKVRSFLGLGLIMLLVKSSLTLSRINLSDRVDTLLSLIGAVALAIHILIALKEKFSLRVFITYAVVSLISLYSVMQTRQLGLLITVLTCMAIRDQDMDEIIYFLYRYSLLLFFLVNVIGTAVGYWRGEALYLVHLNRGARYHFGYFHPNSFSLAFFNLLLLWLWKNYEKLELGGYLKIMAATLLVYCLTKTRTMLLIVCALIVLVFIVKKGWINSGVLSMITMGIVPAFCLFFFWTSTATESTPLWEFIDGILNRRAFLGWFAFEVTGSLTLFGRDVSILTELMKGFTYDCIYTEMMTHHGVIWLIMIAVSFFCLARKNNKKIDIMLIAWALYAVTEVHGMNVFNCFPLLLTSLLINDCEGVSGRNVSV